jgi:hypoxanthine phosphoribosyltransferase
MKPAAVFIMMYLRINNMKDYKDYLLETLISETDLNNRIAELGAEISRDYKESKDLLLVCILRGAVIFLTDLSRKISIPHAIDFMAISSYGAGSGVS